MTIKLTPLQREALLANGTATARCEAADHFPVVKLFDPNGSATWLLTDIDPENPSLAFGLCDLGHGFPELGWLSLDELSTYVGVFGLPIEVDRHFEGVAPISDYAKAARAAGHIVELSKPEGDVR